MKFSVRSDTFSMGSSIDIYWTDGPTSKEVERLVSIFRGATYDGFTESRDFHDVHWHGELVHFAPHFIDGHRTHSVALTTEIARRVSARYDLPMPEIIEGHFGANLRGGTIPVGNGLYTLAETILNEIATTSAYPTLQPEAEEKEDA